MKLHKTRDGDVKTRHVEGGCSVFATAGDSVTLAFRDERGASWGLEMALEEAEEVAASVLRLVSNASPRKPLVSERQRVRESTREKTRP